MAKAVCAVPATTCSPPAAALPQSKDSREGVLLCAGSHTHSSETPAFTEELAVYALGGRSQRQRTSLPAPCPGSQMLEPLQKRADKQVKTSDDSRSWLHSQQLQLKIGVKDQLPPEGPSPQPSCLGACGTMRSLRCLSSEALAAHAPVALQSLDCVAHNLYPLLFKASYLLEQVDLVQALLVRWPLEEFRLGALLGPGTDHPEDLRDRPCRPCLEACVRGLRGHVLRAEGRTHLRLADLTGLRDVQEPRCRCGRTLGRWGRTELLARACLELQAEPRVAGSPTVEVLADLFVTEGNFEAVVRALRQAGTAPLRLLCPSFRADSLRPAQLLQVLRLAGPGALRRLEVVHNVRLHAGHVEQLLAQVRFPRLTALTLPAKAFDAPPLAQGSGPHDEDSHLAAIARALSQMTQLTELSVAFSTLTGKVQQLLGPLQTPLRTLDLANCALNYADMAFLASCPHAAHLEVLDLSGHDLVSLYPSTFFRLLSRAAPSLRALTLEECGIGDQHVNRLVLGLSPCLQLQELRLLGNPLSARALRSLFAALCELPGLRCIEFPVPKDCYPEGATYPQDQLAMSKFDQQKYEEVAGELRAMLLRAGRDDIQASTPLFGTFDPNIQERSQELGAFLLQSFKSALEKFSRALEQME
ncbi:leucine-rich repeat-containing protein 14B [Elephas maximus indicus]|uniref:leucine-rich repeat-containing protein 14B n=1 Tax=Elephas maximus indicus TaxID=99487 RepID=UPI002116699C|nr:leucine-rich repeat-containing protein 14B [Elephas maximus indicus]